jgi:phosphoglycolate phosphatase-like HAD superfamily hydrolase
MSKTGLVVFDLDGTLFPADVATVPAVVRSFRARGLEPPPEDGIRYFIGKPTPLFHAWLAQQAPDGLGAEIAADVDRFEIEAVRGHGRLYDGAQEALAELRAVVARLAVCTNGPAPYVAAVVERCGLAPVFDAIRFLRAGDEGKGQMLGDLLRRLDARPAVMVGDRRDDVLAAGENGIASVAVTYGVGTTEELAGADAVVHAPAEIPGAVLALLARP